MQTRGKAPGAKCSSRAMPRVSRSAQVAAGFKTTGLTSLESSATSCEHGSRHSGATNFRTPFWLNTKRVPVIRARSRARWAARSNAASITPRRTMFVVRLSSNQPTQRLSRIPFPHKRLPNQKRPNPPILQPLDVLTVPPDTFILIDWPLQHDRKASRAAGGI